MGMFTEMADLITPLKRRFRQLPRVVRFLFVLNFFFSLTSFTYLMHYLLLKNVLNNEELLHVTTCPLCFGKSLCDDIHAGKADFKGSSRLRLFNDLSNVKNIFYGDYDNKPVVFKRLAHTSEMVQFDQTYPDPEALPVDKEGILAAKDVNSISDLTYCASERLVDKMVFTYKEKLDVAELNYLEKVQLVTTLKVNPEPILLQMFPQEEGFPFPKYHGACGRFVIEEYMGVPLQDFYNAPWLERANYAYQILQMADSLSNTTNQFALYLLDPSIENFAVSKSGKVYLVDVENVLVVDLWENRQGQFADRVSILYHPANGCKGGELSIQMDKLCTQGYSDFNFYAICHDVFSECTPTNAVPHGLLHGIPETVENRYKLNWLLKECLNPSKPNGRLKAKDGIMTALKNVLYK